MHDPDSHRAAIGVVVSAMSAGVIWRNRQPGANMTPEEAFSVCIAALCHLGVPFDEVQAVIDEVLVAAMFDEEQICECGRHEPCRHKDDADHGLGSYLDVKSMDETDRTDT